MLQLAYLWVIILFSWNYVLSLKLTLQDCNLSFATCGDVNISYPFWLLNTTAVKLNEDYCGYQGYGINCSNGNPILTISNQIYSVRSINYTAHTLTVRDLEYNGKSCPRVHGNYTVNPGFSYADILDNPNRLMKYYSNCSSYPPSSVPYISCLGSTGANRTYVFQQDAVLNFNWNKNCEERFEIPVLNTAPNISKNVTTYDSILQLGFRMEWYLQPGCNSCESSGGKCGHDPFRNAILCYCPTYTAVVDVITDCNAFQDAGISRSKKIAIGVSSGVGILILIMIVYIFMYKRNMYFHCCQICKLKNRSRKNKNVEAFLEDYGRLALHRYRYSELKKITNRFKDKLGQGGYGGVFKGKLKDGRLVAVKVLTESKGNGEEFINEVATIGRTNHVNIVSLLGYCSEGSKRALVYEFMPNGSLEKFICNEKNTSATHPLGWEKLYQIALGIANGLEYLHRGCNIRILHFDIKPHNILLDKDFCPKISDFGLAKLCAARESIVSMLNARGTIGYIAPEVYCRNFGGVSSKSDVYSYGMLLLEMVGGKKSIDATVYNTDSDDIYFPEWIYNHLEKHGNIGLGGFNEMSAEERKMIIVGLWSIQTHPVNRPSMTMVVEMLQKSLDDLQIPPNPFQEPAT